MLFLSEKLNDPRIPGKILFNEDENAHLPPHWHSNVEICFFLQGGFCARSWSTAASSTMWAKTPLGNAGASRW